MSEQRQLSLLVIEDEPLVTMLLKEMIEELGHSVAATASSIARAEAALDGVDRFDAAIVDLNLGGQSAVPILERLAREAVPFVLATGYGERDINGVPAPTAVLRKPFREAELRRALDILSETCGSSGAA